MNFRGVCCVALCFAGLSIARGAPRGDAADYREGDVLVTFKPVADLQTARDILSSHGLSMTRNFGFLSAQQGQQICLVRGTNWTTAALMAELGGEAFVETVEPNFFRHALGTQPPNDPSFPQLWGLQNSGQTIRGVSGISGADIKFTSAWNLARPNTNPVVVAVIDSGVNYAHPDLAANIWVNSGEVAENGLDDDHNGYIDDYHGYNFAADTSDPSDSGEHGSHVAGTIAAVGNNQLGVVGVDYRAKIMPLAVSEDGHTFLTSALIEAVQYAAMMKHLGVNVVAINASYGGASSSSAERTAILTAGAEGIVFCAAAGNDAANNDSVRTYPASYRLTNMIVVAASDQSDALASFSNYGASTVDLAAPGVNILSTTPPGMTSYVQVASVIYAGDSLEYAGKTQGGTGTLYDCGLGYPTNFPAGVRGNLALISRGTLFFSEKVSNAMAAGAIGAVIYNNVATPFAGTLGSAGVWIPAIIVSQAEGLAIKASLPAAGTLYNAIDSRVIYQFLDGTSMAAPHVAGAVAFAAMNFPTETVGQRIQRILSHVDPVSGLTGKVVTGGRLNLLRTVDANGNGLPDWWEGRYFSGQASVDPLADPDGDGMSNRQEYLADTDPTDARSKVQFTEIQALPGGTRISWSAGSEARQYLQRATSLAANAQWVDVWTNTPPTGTNGLFLDSSSANQPRFYRLRVERP